jgi:cyclic pyranopterin phosphate synthase
MTGISDPFQRQIDYIRVSVTDRCNLRCVYCMPPEGINLAPHWQILSYEEITKVIRAASDLGVSKVRLTGGEPLVRPHLVELVKMIKDLGTVDDLALTTNGLLLSRYARALKDAGLDRVNVSLDTLKPERFEQITRHGKLSDALAGIRSAGKVGLTPVKINVVLMRGVNDDELLDFARMSVEEDWNVRFIEPMPFDNVAEANLRNDTVCSGAESRRDGYMSVAEMQQQIGAMGTLESLNLQNNGARDFPGNGPANYFRLPGAKGTLGFISPVSDLFCSGCNRLRLTADGKLRPCLLSDVEFDLKGPLREGATDEEIRQLIVKVVDNKPEKHHLDESVTPTARGMSQIGG